jgi:NitT/TauT family transport system ATP-binding protein
VLELTDLTKSYGRGPAARTAISGLNLIVAPGELVSIVGPSGCGKSTLLRCIAGLVPPTGGRVVLRGVPVDDVPDGLAVVLQDYGRSLYPWLSVRDNVAMPLRRTTRGRAARRKAADAALAAVALPDAGDQYPWQLSGGMQQRVAIARALAYNPAVLLMDEPFAALDALTRDDMQQLLAEVWRTTRKTVIYVTHNVAEAVYLADRVVVMTPHPGTVKTEVPIALARPRDPLSVEFLDYQKQLLRLLGQEKSA